MFSELILLHRKGQRDFELRGGAASVSGELWSFRTCLRKILIVSESSLASIQLVEGDEVFRGADAFRFCLQVIAGLQSPLIGETEVAGQFRTVVQNFAIPHGPWGHQLKRFFAALFEDVKKVRQKHLTDLGSQSYGSLLRRDLRGCKQIHIVGAGGFVKDLMPWLNKDGAKIVVHARNILKAQQTLNEFSNIEFQSLEQLQVGAGVLLVAAPIAARDLVFSHESSHGDSPGMSSGFDLLVDLRGDAHIDQVKFSKKKIDLQELLSRIQANQEFLEAKKRDALCEIEMIVEDRSRSIEYRPFGWEDVCA